MSVGSHEAFDPTVFNDEVAMKTDWKPMIGTRSNYDSRELVEAKRNKLVYKQTAGNKVFAGLLVVVPILVVIFGPFSAENRFVMLVVGLVFVFAGVILYFSESSPITFDKQKQLFTRGKTQLKFEDIHAIQIVRHSVKTPDISYVEKQLNLVEKTGERVHIHAHSSSDVARANAKRISEFLNIQVWDALP